MSGKITINELQSDFGNDIINAIDKINNLSTIANPVNIGMNTVIRKTNGITTIPKFTINGKGYVNLLGKDGDCEDISKWNTWQSTLSLDSSKKVHGTNAIKMTISATGGNMYKYLNTTAFDPSKYYMVSACLDAGTATDVYIVKDATGGGVQKVKVSTATSPTRVMFKLQPSDNNIGNVFSIGADGSSGQYVYIDGVMINEITPSDYANLTEQQLLDKYPYVDSYACLENPYIEVRHDNLVRNGNGEEGISWWIIPEPTVVETKYADGYIQIKRSSGTGYGTLYQHINVKPNTTYSLRCITKISSSSYKSSVVVEQSDDGIAYSWLATLFEINSTTDTICTKSFTPTKQYIRLAILEPNVEQGTIVYFKEISIIEGTTIPTSYKSCRIERCVIEGKFTSNDSFTYENGEISGLLNWKHKTLYGKDYEYKFEESYSNFRRCIVLHKFFRNPSVRPIIIKYDGKPLTQTTSWANSDEFEMTGDGIATRITINNVDAGWVESINPNNDEVKVFMNGWKAVNNLTTRYTAWIGIVNGAIPSGTAHTTLTVAYAGSATSITVASATGFVVGDKICIQNSSGGYNYRGISSISGNVINIDLALPASGGKIDGNVFKCDNGTTTDLLNYCKNNVAPNYEGYQLHYKLANPEPITDINTHIHGDIPKFDNGDNYLYLDYGMVIGELANPAKGANEDYKINKNSTTSTAQNTECKNRVQIFNAIYKNQIFDSSWSDDVATAYGNIAKSCANYDTNATYTVDYQILKTLNTPPTEINIEYKQSLVNTIEDLVESVNSRQKHDSVLDSIVDLSVYEEIIYQNWGRACDFGPTGVFISNNIQFNTIKKVRPIIKISEINVLASNTTSTYHIPIKDFRLDIDVLTKGMMRLSVWYTGNDATIRSNLLNYGMFVSIKIIADCRKKI